MFKTLLLERATCLLGRDNVLRIVFPNEVFCRKEPTSWEHSSDYVIMIESLQKILLKRKSPKIPTAPFA